MPSIGPMEIVVVLVIALLILGPKKLPSAAKSMGEGIRGFKDSLSGKPDPADDAPQPKLVAAAPVDVAAASGATDAEPVAEKV